MFRRPTPFGCTQALPNVSALRMPAHFGVGRGGSHRSSPTGGAAYGIPLDTRTPGAAAVVPESRPASVAIGSLTTARKTPAIAIAAANIAPIPASRGFGDRALVIVAPPCTLRSRTSAIVYGAPRKTSGSHKAYVFLYKRGERP